MPARSTSWIALAAAGVVAALVTLAGPLTLGLLAYASLGPAAAGIGLPAAFAAVSLGGLLVALLGRSAIPAAGLSSATTLIFASAVAGLAVDPRLHLGDSAADVAALAAVASCTVLAMGLLQVVFGVFGLGSLARLVPQPVLAGFMNGVAILVMAAQLPLLLGIAPAGWTWWNGSLQALQPATWVVGAVTMATIWIVGARFPAAPASLLGLAVGAGLYFAIFRLLPEARLGPLVGAVPHHLPLPDDMLPLVRGTHGPAVDLLLRHAGALGITALLLAIVGSLETVLGSLATDLQLVTRHDVDRDLIVFGMANVVSACFGGLPLVYWRARAMAIWRTRGRGRATAASAALMSGLVFLGAGHLIALFPRVVLAGVMVTIAVGLMDRWSWRLIARVLAGDTTRELRISLALVGAVCVVTLWLGFVAGVATGLVLSTGLFVLAMNRSLVRASYTAAFRPSRRIHPPAHEGMLIDARHRITVIELEGALFFGNGERLALVVEGLPADCLFLVLDLHRVGTLDASGATALEHVAARLAKRGARLLLSGVAVQSPHGQVLRAFGRAGVEARGDWFPDIDRAVEAAERNLLDDAGRVTEAPDVALDATGLLQGLSARQMALVRDEFEPHHLRAGEILFRQGDPGDCVFVLTRGSISIVAHADDPSASQRFVSFSHGMMFGETAMLDGEGRSADAIADTDALVHRLTQARIDRLRTIDADLVLQLYRNMATHLSQRLRKATNAR